MNRSCCGADDGSMCADDCFRRWFAEWVRKEAVRETAKGTGMAEKCVENFADLLRGGWQASSDVAKDALLAWQTNYAMAEREHMEALRKDPVHKEACCRIAPEVASGWDEGTMHGCVLDFLEDELDKMLRKGWFIEVIRRYAQHRREVEQEKRVEQQKHEAAMSVAATGARGYWSAIDAIDAVAQRFDEPRLSADEMNRAHDEASRQVNDCMRHGAFANEHAPVLTLDKIQEASKAMRAARPMSPWMKALRDNMPQTIAGGKDEAMAGKKDETMATLLFGNGFGVMLPEVDVVKSQEDADRLWGKGAVPDMEAMASVGGKVALVPLKRPKPAKVEPGQKWRHECHPRAFVVGSVESGGFRFVETPEALRYTGPFLRDSAWEYMGMEKPQEVRVGQRWRRESGADFTVESVCGTNVLLSNGGVFTIEDLLTSPRYEYLGMAAESPDGLKHGTVHRDMPGARPARSVKVALDPKKLKPGAQRDRNVAYAQWFIDECPSWAYPLGWKLAVMAVCEWCGNRDVPAPFTTIWGSGQGAMKLLALYHEARRDGLLPEHAKRKAAHREPNEVEHLICDAYERGRR